MKLKILQLTNLRALLTLVALSACTMLFAQPANDNCSGAISLTLAPNEASAVWTNGTTLNTVDAAGVVGPTVCSTNFYRDDVWYKLTIPTSSTKKAFTIKIDNTTPGGMTLAGMAIYPTNSCAASNAPYICGNFAAGDLTQFRLGLECFTPGSEILVRVWSGDGTAANYKTGEGTFRIAAFYSDDASLGTVLWGNNGEGSFNGGLNGWTTTSASCNNFPLWFWSKDTMCTKGKYSTGGGKITSLTACNGAMCFDSDFYDTGGVNGSAGTGPCPATQSGTLESPVIDLSGFPNVKGVNVVFNQALRQFQSNYFVEWSIDGGTNWQSTEINTAAEDPTNYAVNGPHLNNVRRVYLPGAAGQSNVKVRFRLEGNYYYWIIDDVYITEREAYNTKVNPFYAIAPNKEWQKDQLTCFGGLADVANIGSKNATNVKLNLQIFDASNTSIWQDNLNYNTVSADSVIQNVPMSNNFCMPSNTPMDYKGVYTVSADSTDFDLKDNTQTFNWSVTDSVMAKDGLGSVMAGGVRPSTSVNFTWGNIYHIENAQNSAGEQLYCNYVDVGINNPNLLAGATIYVWLYKWNNANDDAIAQVDERTTVAYTQYDFPAGEAANTLYTLPMYDFLTFTPGVALEPNTEYIAAVQYSAPADMPDLALFVNSDGFIDYSATDLRTTLPGAGPVRFSHVLDVANTGIFNCNTFTGGTTPVVRMHVTNEHIVIGTTEPKLDDANVVVVAPNPVAYDLNVKINLVKEATTARINVTDISGKEVLSRNLYNVKSSTETFNVATLSNGTYFLKFTTDKGVRTVKFIVSK